ncbi:hypothetical protein HJ019_24055, partial [Vibrio parahaemolyticus]|nr:hypothetical protein [Vibrio parahaemolyticus]
ELLELGIDISIPNSKEPVSNVVPLNRVIEMRPAGIPDWAFGTVLTFLNLENLLLRDSAR